LFGSLHFQHFLPPVPKNWLFGIGAAAAENYHMVSAEIEEQNDYRLEDGMTLCRETYPGLEIEQCKRHEPCSMPMYHYHDGYEIYYLLSGSRNYFIDEINYRVEKGSLVLINKGVPHMTTYGGSPMHERILINFDEDFIQGIRIQSDNEDLLAPFYQNKPVVRLQKADQAAVEQLLFKMMMEARGKDFGHESYVRLVLGELLLFITRKILDTRPADSLNTNFMNAKISEIIKYVNIRYMKKISLESIAENFYISPYYLSRTFKKATGTTFIEYLNGIRVRESQILLKESPLNVNTIAERVGYESQTHFGRVFKKYTGMSPLQYRKME
jgi:AraC-like DNA-binding protein/mannose-6-phosphate isomerase-like protein (cupin superfamily)